MPLRSRAKGWVKITLFSLAWLFLMVGLARPQIGARLKENTKKGAEIMIALDVSNSMLAQDYSPNRLERAKLAISRLVDKLQGDRIGLIVFAGESFVQLPITTDYVSAKIFLNTINTRSVPVQGTAMGDAITTAIKSFSNETAQRKNDKAIILITDGENHEDDPVQAAKQAAELGIKVFTIGVGSLDGQPIPVAGGELMKDRSGNIVVTKLDEKTLTEVAAAGDGAYISLPTGAKIHLGNFVCIMASLLCGGLVGGITGSLGMGLNDIASGYAWTTTLRTFILKFIMGLVIGLIFTYIFKKKKKQTIPLFILSGVFALVFVITLVVFIN